jgi:hypothetical protein
VLARSCLLIGFAAALSTSLAIAQQDSRYSPPATGQFQSSTGASPATDKSSAAGSESSTNRSLLDMTSPPPANGDVSSSFRSTPAANDTQPKTLPLNNRDTQPIRGSAQNPETPAAYGFTTPSSNATAPPPDGALKPSGMMRAMMFAPPGSQLHGQPVSLMEVVGTGRNRVEQSQRIDAYWDMCASVADYYLGLRELDEAQKLHTYSQQNGGLWAQAESDLRIRLNTSLKSAQASQLKVATLTGRGLNNLPLPADNPHCATYISHYDQIFQGGGPAEARELATLLPLRFAELENAAADVSRAEQHYESVSRQGDADSMNALRLLALQRRAFVQIARDYNERIARYLDLASPGQLSASRLTGMLINTGVSSTATRSASPAPPVRRQSSNESAPPPTFAAGSPPAVKPNGDETIHDDAVKATSATESTAAHSPPRQEKSLLVSPQRSSASYP